MHLPLAQVTQPWKVVYLNQTKNQTDHETRISKSTPKKMKIDEDSLWTLNIKSLSYEQNC